MDEQRSQAPVHPPGGFRIGSIGGVDVLIRGSWLLVAALIAVMLAPRVDQVQPGLGALKYVAGLAFAVLFYLSVLLHEMSHALVAKHFGMNVKSISLHFLGGMTELEGESATAGQEFKIAVVGPLTSIAVGLVSLALLLVLNHGLIGMAVEGLAGANLILGVLNLIPGLPLDGGRVLRAVVWKASGDQHRGTIVAAWGGRATAFLALCTPAIEKTFFHVEPQLIDYVVACIMASFLWAGASASLIGARVRQQLPALKARPLARRVIAVPEELSLAEALRRAREAGAGAIVTHTADDRLSGLVSEAALRDTPEERRPWLPVSAVARSMEDGLVLPADVAGEDLVRALDRTPATEYVLVENDGSLFGVLTTLDVDRAFESGVRK